MAVMQWVLPDELDDLYIYLPLSALRARWLTGRLPGWMVPNLADAVSQVNFVILNKQTVLLGGFIPEHRAIEEFLMMHLSPEPRAMLRVLRTSAVKRPTQMKAFSLPARVASVVEREIADMQRAAANETATEEAAAMYTGADTIGLAARVQENVARSRCASEKMLAAYTTAWAELVQKDKTDHAEHVTQQNMRKAAIAKDKSLLDEHARIGGMCVPSLDSGFGAWCIRVNAALEAYTTNKVELGKVLKSTAPYDKPYQSTIQMLMSCHRAGIEANIIPILTSLKERVTELLVADGAK